MKKRKKTLLLLIIMLAVVAAGFAIVLSVNNNNEPEEADVQNAPLLGISEEDITALSYTYEGSSLSFERGENGFALSGEPDFPLDQSIVENMLSALCGATASREIDPEAELSEYGFDDSAISVEIDAADGSKTLSLGGKNGQTGMLYAMLDGRVYATEASLRSAFERGLNELIRMDGLPDIESISKAEVKAADGGFSIEYIEESGEAFFSKSYNYYYSDSERSHSALETSEAESWISRIKSLSPVRCDMWNPNAAAVSARGLDEPVGVEIEYENANGGGSISVYFGSRFEDEDGRAYRYMMFGGSDMIYVVNADTADAIINPDVNSMLPAHVADISFRSLKAADINIGGGEFSMEFVKSEGATTVYLDGEEVSPVYAESFFVDLADTEWERIAPQDAKAASETPVMSFKLKTDKGETVIELFEYDASFRLAHVSGRTEAMLVNIRGADALEKSWADMLKNMGK